MSNPTFATEYDAVIDAAPNAVFAALSEPEKIVEFWGEAGVYQTMSWQHDFRVGGMYRHTTLHVDGTSQVGQRFARFGEYRAIDPSRALEYTSKYESDMPIAEVTTIRFDLEPTNDGKTHLRVSQFGFGNPDMRDMHRAAWVQVFGWLNDYLTAKR